jgi:hypothetical protein
MATPDQFEISRIPKKNQGFRYTFIANEELAKEQDELLRAIRSTHLEDFMPHAHGGVTGKSPLTNARQHQGGEMFYMLDLWRAYSGVDHQYLRAMSSVALSGLTDLLWPVPEMVDDTVNRLVLAEGISGLPTGFSTSPMFYNINCMQLDASLASFCDEEGMTYTRYLDDLTFSSPLDVLSSRALRKKLRSKITEIPGASIRDSKARLDEMHSRSKYGNVTITGVTITREEGYVYPSRELLNKVDDYFTRIEIKLETGQYITENDLGKLHGYFGVLSLGGSARESQSRYVGQLIERYEALVMRTGK